MSPSHYNPQECDCLVVIIPSFKMSYAIIMVPYCSNTTEISHNVITLPYHALINNLGRMVSAEILLIEAKYSRGGGL